MHSGIQTIIRTALWGSAIPVLLANLGTSPTIASSQANRRVFRSEFRYVILSNEIESTGRKHRTRSVDILLDPKAFSEQNLRKLF
jgi:hypothetical protein